MPVLKSYHRRSPALKDVGKIQREMWTSFGNGRFFFFFFWGKDGEFERGREEEDEKMGREMNKIEESRLLLQKMSTV